ncbi:MAG: spore coat protein U domain-containing protein [Alphaproteobacteria bacterium]
MTNLTLRIVETLRRLALATLLALASGLVASLAAPSQSLAQNCSATLADIQFGNIDVTANTTIDTTSRLTVSCTGTAGRTVRVCAEFGQGSGGADAGLNPRYMAAGAAPLAYNLYTNNARTTIWGNSSEPATNIPTIDVLIGTNGTGRANQNVFARVIAGQRTVPIGSYSTSLAGGDTRLRFAYATSATCSSLGAAIEQPLSLSVFAAVIPRCTVSATNLDFGATGQLTSSRDATNRLSVVCTSGAPYSIGLDGGLAASTDPTRRSMSKGSETIFYGLYRNAGRTLPWGSNAGIDTMGASGTGGTQSFTVFGRVPTQTTPSPGVYSDTVIVTVTY